MQTTDAIYATLCRSVLPESHCVSKLGGQVAFAQQFESSFFGTTVPSDHDETLKVGAEEQVSM